MSQKNDIHYNIDTLDKEGSQINWILGERSNGKSYQVKHKKGIYRYWEDGVNYHASYRDKKKIEEVIINKKTKRFGLIRRLQEEIKPSAAINYFSDIDVEKITNGQYNTFEIFKERVYLAYYDIETRKTKRGEFIGYLFALSVEQNYAGGSYLDITDLIFEEVITRKIYLQNEPSKLMNLYCTIDRKRGTTRLWLPGNTISKVCPYFEEWGIYDLIKGLKQGEIKSRWIKTGDKDEDGIDVEVKISVEYCKSSGRSSFVIGKHSEMLNTGTWQTEPQPHLPKSINEYNKAFTIGFCYQSFKFLGDLLLDKTSRDMVWFVYPYYGEFDNKTIIFSDIIKPSRYWQRDIYRPQLKNKRICEILKTFVESNIFYSSDLCGTDFKQVIDFDIRK